LVDRFLDFDATDKTPHQPKESYFTRSEVFSEGNVPVVGKSRANSILRTAPPLNLAVLHNNNNNNIKHSTANSESKNATGEFFEGDDSLLSPDSNFAAGQPLNAVRRAKTQK
jgi:hypothetical protein